MTNKNLYLYIQRFFSKILVKPVNSKHTILSKKSSNSSTLFFKSKNRKFFLSYKHPKKKLFVILVLRKGSVLFSTCQAKELKASPRVLLEKRGTKDNSYFFYLALRLPTPGGGCKPGGAIQKVIQSLSLTRTTQILGACLAPKGHGPLGPYFSKAKYKASNHGPTDLPKRQGPFFHVFYSAHCFLPFWGVTLIIRGPWFMALKSSLKTTYQGSFFYVSLAYFPFIKSLLRNDNLAQEVKTNHHNLMQLVFFATFCVVVQPVFFPSLGKNVLENTTPKTRYLVFFKHFFFKKIKKVKRGKWCAPKGAIHKKRSIFKTFYFVFCMFLKTGSQKNSLNLLLDSQSAYKYLNKTSLILINFYRICKLYKQLNKTQIVIDQKFYNNLKFFIFKFENCLVIRSIIKSKPFIQRIEYLKVKSFNSYNFQIFRPLLSITRLDTFYLSESLKLPVYPDKTNLEVQFLRNRIRKQILPAIRILVNPQFDTILCNFSESHVVIKNINKL